MSALITNLPCEYYGHNCTRFWKKLHQGRWQRSRVQAKSEYTHTKQEAPRSKVSHEIDSKTRRGIKSTRCGDREEIPNHLGFRDSTREI